MRITLVHSTPTLLLTLSPSFTDSRHINERKEATIHLWKNLKELSDARTKVLAMAKKIHAFNREADDMIHQITVSGLKESLTINGYKK